MACVRARLAGLPGTRQSDGPAPTSPITAPSNPTPPSWTKDTTMGWYWQPRHGSTDVLDATTIINPTTTNEIILGFSAKYNPQLHPQRHVHDGQPGPGLPVALSGVGLGRRQFRSRDPILGLRYREHTRRSVPTATRTLPTTTTSTWPTTSPRSSPRTRSRLESCSRSTARTRPPARIFRAPSNSTTTSTTTPTRPPTSTPTC